MISCYIWAPAAVSLLHHESAVFHQPLAPLRRFGAADCRCRWCLVKADGAAEFRLQQFEFLISQCFFFFFHSLPVVEVSSLGESADFTGRCRRVGLDRSRAGGGVEGIGETLAPSGGQCCAAVLSCVSKTQKHKVLLQRTNADESSVFQILCFISVLYLLRS